MNKDYLKKLKIPDQPGVYFFLKGKEVLYIGKATSLKDRVKSYFGRDLIETRGPIILDMVFKANKIKWETTDSVLEALILEASLIKKYQPKYNTKEKSDKSFNYVCITDEKLPKVVVVRGKNLLLQKQKNFSRFTLPGVPGGTYAMTNSFVSSVKPSSVFGPFTNSAQLREALRLIRKIFPFLDERSKNYMEFYKQINLVPDLKDTKMYLQNIKNIKLFFSGKKPQILKSLKKEMASYSKKHEFEKAGEIKRQTFALNHINDVALLKGEDVPYSLFSSLRTAKPNSSLGKQRIRDIFRIEAYDIAHLGGKNMVGVMVVVEDEMPAKSKYRKFKIRTQANANDTGALKEVLERRLAHTEWHYPALIVVDGGRAQLNVARNVLKKMNIDIPVVSVVKDEKHKPKMILSSPVKVFLKSSEKIPRPFKNLPRASILLANSEAHRFAIKYHKEMRAKNFLKK